MTRFETTSTMPPNLQKSDRNGPRPTHPAFRTRGRGRLASARDRQRLRERERAERERVERMLATAPLPESRGVPDPEPRLRALPGSTCPVCTSAKIVRDEVYRTGLLRLAECLHCDHRWTERPRSRWAELGAGMTRGRILASVPG